MNPLSQHYRELLRQHKPDVPTEKYLPEAAVIRKIMKGPSFEEPEPLQQPVEESDSDSDEKVIDFSQQLAELIKLQGARNEGPKRGIPI